VPLDDIKLNDPHGYGRRGACSDAEGNLVETRMRESDLTTVLSHFVTMMIGFVKKSRPTSIFGIFLSSEPCITYI
jgi:hypothetical protein